MYSSAALEPEALALDRLAPPLPRLDRHLVPAPAQRPRQRDRRERVPGIAERGDQQPLIAHAGRPCTSHLPLSTHELPPSWPDGSRDPQPRPAPAHRRRRAAAAHPRRNARGIDENRIIVGAYTDPRLRRHLPDARRPPQRRPHRASPLRPLPGTPSPTPAPPPRHPREVRTLRMLPRDEPPRATSTGADSVAEIAGADPRRAPQASARSPRTPVTSLSRDTGERHRGRELRNRPFWAWLRPTRRYDVFAENVAAARSSSTSSAPPTPRARARDLQPSTRPIPLCRRLELAGPREDDLRDQAGRRRPQQEAQPPPRCPPAGSSRPTLTCPRPSRSSACRRTRGRAPSPGSPGRRSPSASPG